MAQGFPPREITEHRLPQTEMACCYVPRRGSAGILVQAAVLNR